MKKIIFKYRVYTLIVIFLKIRWMEEAHFHFFFCGVLKHGDQCNALFKAMDSYVQTKELDPYHLKSLTVLSQVD